MAVNTRSFKISGRVRVWFLALFAVLNIFVMQVTPSYAQNPLVCPWCACIACTSQDCSTSPNTVIQHHANGRIMILVHISTQFSEYREWLLRTFLRNNLIKSMMLMTEQLSAVGMAQMQGVGMLMDAQIQLETQRSLQELQARALKDYHPSENFCYFGTNVRSLSASQHRGEYNRMALNKIALDRQTSNSVAAGARTAIQDQKSRWDLFVQQNCMVINNAWKEDEPDYSGLQPLCRTSASETVRANADIDYGRIIDSPRSLDIDFTNPGAAPAGPGPAPPTPPDFTTLEASVTEQDVIALSRNIYGHEPLLRGVGFLDQESGQERLISLRRVAAKRNVAQNTFNSIVGLKTAGTANLGAEADRTMGYMASIMRDLGVTDYDEIRSLLGDNPSYLAQLEVMAKRIYQNPGFYANLYDKPENVMRTSVALRAIELMLDRTIYESRLRKEMLVSVLLATKLEDEYVPVQAKLEELAE